MATVAKPLADQMNGTLPGIDPAIARELRRDRRAEAHVAARSKRRRRVSAISPARTRDREQSSPAQRAGRNLSRRLLFGHPAWPVAARWIWADDAQARCPTATHQAAGTPGKESRVSATRRFGISAIWVRPLEMCIRTTIGSFRRRDHARASRKGRHPAKEKHTAPPLSPARRRRSAHG